MVVWSAVLRSLYGSATDRPVRAVHSAQNCEQESLKRFVEDGLMPYLGEVTNLVLDDDVEGAVLVQGKLATRHGRKIFIGPQYVPEGVRDFYIPVSSEWPQMA